MSPRTLTLAIIGSVFCMPLSASCQAAPAALEYRVLELSGGTGHVLLYGGQHLGVVAPHAERRGEALDIQLPATVHLQRGDSIEVKSLTNVRVGYSADTVSLLGKTIRVRWATSEDAPTLCAGATRADQPKVRNN
jgi:hypothetical protein